VSGPEAPVRSDSFRPVLGATVLLVFALLALASLKSNRDLQAARSRERTLREKIAATRAESERLRVRIDRLRHDPGMLETLAREDLGMVRPRDVVIELPDPKAAPAPGAPPIPVPPAETQAVPAANPHPPAPSPDPSRPPSPGEGEKARPTPAVGAAGPPSPAKPPLLPGAASSGRPGRG
jgi:cell division protein FtsB